MKFFASALILALALLSFDQAYGQGYFGNGSVPKKGKPCENTFMDCDPWHTYMRCGATKVCECSQAEFPDGLSIEMIWNEGKGKCVSKANSVCNEVKGIVCEEGLTCVKRPGGRDPGLGKCKKSESTTTTTTSSESPVSDHD